MRRYVLAVLVLTGATATYFAVGQRDGSVAESTLTSTPIEPVAPPLKVVHEWHMWGRDFTHNAVSLETGVSLDFKLPFTPEDLEKKIVAKHVAWTGALGRTCLVPPVVSDGLVWCCTNGVPPPDNPDGTSVPSKYWDGGVLVCFRESDGKELWRHRSPRREKRIWVEDFGQAALGSVPYVEGDRLWYMNNRNEVVCFDISRLKNGTGTPVEVWNLDTKKELGVFPHLPLMQGGTAGSVAGWKDRLFVVTHNGVDESHINIPSPEAPSLACLDKITGKVLWTDNSPGKNIMHVQISSPLACEVNGRAQVIVGQGDGWLRSFDPITGRLMWKCDLNAKGTFYDLGGTGTRNYIVATPVLYDGLVYIATGTDVERGHGFPAALYCIDPTKEGDVSRELVTWPGKVIANPNSAVVWYTPEQVPDDAPRVTINRKGKPIDLLRDRRDFYYGRTIANITAHDGLVYAGELQGWLFCFDAKTGRCYWFDDLKASIWGQPLWVDGKVMVATEANGVFVYAHGKELKRLAHVDCDERLRAGPIFANGMLYLCGDNSVFAIRKPK